MHANVFHDNIFALSCETLLPEVCYRSRAPPLSCLHNRYLLSRNRTFVTEQQRGNVKVEVINTLAGFKIGYPGGDPVGVFAAPCGFNHNEVEIIAFGGQTDATAGNSSVLVNEDPLAECFKQVFRREIDLGITKTFDMKTESASSFKLPNNEAVHQLLKSHEERENGGSPAFSSLFRFKRLAKFQPRCFGPDRITDIQVDAKRQEAPLIYARNGQGFAVGKLDVENWPVQALKDLPDDVGIFPSVKPSVITDIKFHEDNFFNFLIINPHEYGVFGALTARRQLTIWDTTICAPIHKIDIGKSALRHAGQDEMHNKNFGNIPSEIIECGTYTDRTDQLIIGGSKLYLIDTRMRSMGFLFPSFSSRPPASYNYPKLTTRLPESDHFAAIERHPDVSTLYAVISAVSSAILLWDIRNPSQIIEELPLPLLKQGRGRFRSLSWARVPKETSPSNDDALYVLSAFSWNHGLVTANILSVYGSSVNTAEEPSIREEALCSIVAKASPFNERELTPKGSLSSAASEEMDQPTLEEDEEEEDFDQNNEFAVDLELEEGMMLPLEIEENQRPASLVAHVSGTSNETSNLVPLTEFWQAAEDGRRSGRKCPPFYVDPFCLFPSPLSSLLPVCDPSGLCFSSARPSIQIVVYRQVSLVKDTQANFQLQVALGIPSIISETEYFCPLGPSLTSASSLLKTSFESPLAEAPLTQLFHGLAGVQFLPMRLPGRKQKQLVAFSLTFSGRLLAIPLLPVRHDRTGFFRKGDTESHNNLLQATQFLFEAPTSDRVKSNAGPLPGFDAFCDALQGGKIPSEKRKKGLSWNLAPASAVDMALKSSHTNTSHKAFFSSLGYHEKTQALGLRGLHELLRPNWDNLEHYALVLGENMRLNWRRLETMACLNCPQINPVFFAEALLDLAMTAPSSLKTFTDPPISIQTMKDTLTPAPWRSAPRELKLYDVEELLEAPQQNSQGFETVKAPQTAALTLFELLAGCGSDHVFLESLNKIKNDVAEGKLLFWTSSCAGAEFIETELMPYDSQRKVNGALFSFAPIPERVATPLCTCKSMRALCPIKLPPDPQDSKEFSWVTFAPKGQPVELRSMARLLCQYLKKKSLGRHGSVVPSGSKLHLPDLEFVWRSMLGTLNAIPLPSKFISQSTLLEAVEPTCDLFPQQNKFCCLHDTFVFTKKAQIDWILPVLTQGSKFITVSPESLAQADPVEREFILQNAPRDYPASYSSLMGVRVSVDLVENLFHNWVLQADKSAPFAVVGPVNRFFSPFESQGAIELQREYSASQIVGLSSSFALPRLATLAEREQSLKHGARKHRTTISALTAQLSQRTRLSHEPTLRNTMSTLLRSVIQQATPSQHLSEAASRTSMRDDDEMSHSSTNSKTPEVHANALAMLPIHQSSSSEVSNADEDNDRLADKQNSDSLGE